MVSSRLSDADLHCYQMIHIANVGKAGPFLCGSATNETVPPLRLSLIAQRCPWVRDNVKVCFDIFFRQHRQAL